MLDQRKLPLLADLIPSIPSCPPSPPGWVERGRGRTLEPLPYPAGTWRSPSSGSDEGDREAEVERRVEAAVSRAIDEGIGIVDLSSGFTQAECKITKIPKVLADLDKLTLLDDIMMEEEEEEEKKEEENRDKTYSGYTGALKPHGLRLLLSGNALTHLGPEILSLHKLAVLTLNGNHLSTLPPQIAQLTMLRELHVGGNRLTRLPIEILGLPRLQALSYLPNPLDPPPPQGDQEEEGGSCTLHPNDPDHQGKGVLSLHELSYRALSHYLNHHSSLGPSDPSLHSLLPFLPPPLQDQLKRILWQRCPSCHSSYAQPLRAGVFWVPCTSRSTGKSLQIPFQVSLCSRSCSSPSRLLQARHRWSNILSRISQSI
ncbi:MAG: hypothetical protein DHS80DRAFT_25411 [Piptocephalis tieghemiana]|nr:MAG: hypothetical protein DHS80DRAFT_25411 [Piptocephalis tieghemiana]